MSNDERMIQTQAAVISRQNAYINAMKQQRADAIQTVLDVARKAKFYDLLVAAVSETPSMQSDWDSLCMALKLAHPEADNWVQLAKEYEDKLVRDLERDFR